MSFERTHVLNYDTAAVHLKNRSDMARRSASCHISLHILLAVVEYLLNMLGAEGRKKGQIVA